MYHLRVWESLCSICNTSQKELVRSVSSWFPSLCWCTISSTPRVLELKTTLPQKEVFAGRCTKWKHAGIHVHRLLVFPGSCSCVITVGSQSCCHPEEFWHGPQRSDLFVLLLFMQAPWYFPVKIFFLQVKRVSSLFLSQGKFYAPSLLDLVCCTYLVNFSSPQWL